MIRGLLRENCKFILDWFLRAEDIISLQFTVIKRLWIFYCTLPFQTDNRICWTKMKWSKVGTLSPWIWKHTMSINNLMGMKWMFDYVSTLRKLDFNFLKYVYLEIMYLEYLRSWVLRWNMALFHNPQVANRKSFMQQLFTCDVRFSSFRHFGWWSTAGLYNTHYSCICCALPQGGTYTSFPSSNVVVRLISCTLTHL